MSLLPSEGLLPAECTNEGLIFVTAAVDSQPGFWILCSQCGVWSIGNETLETAEKSKRGGSRSETPNVELPLSKTENPHFVA